MATIALFHAPFQSHLRLAGRLSQVLADRGHRVIAWSPPERGELLRHSGAQLREDPCSAQVWETLRAIGRPPGSRGAELATRVALEEATASGFADLVGELLADGVELVIHDAMAPWGALAARWIALPTVSSVVAHTLAPPREPERADPDPDPSANADPELDGRLRRARAVTRSAWAMAAASGRPFAGPYGDRTVLYTSPELTGALITHPSRRFVGPLEPGDEATGRLEEPALAGLGGRPLVLMALGTLMTDRAELLRAALEGLAEEPVELLLATGERFSPAGLENVPANARVLARVEQTAVLRRASVFITHAGINSVLEALLAGVPMLCAPGAGDQLAGADRVVELGAGRMLGAERAKALRDGVRALLADPAPRARAASVGAGLRATGGREYAVQVVEELLDGDG
ncbi:MAG: hypothetical protein M3Z06_09995 [Actinomycetota bacterium]|nr:hypothetical protein [Actinomycetota bacterium]